MGTFAVRVKRIQEIMKSQGTDYLVLAPSSQMFYLTGLKTTADERFQGFLVPAEGTPILVLPKMYQEAAMHLAEKNFDLLTWGDGLDPVSLLLPVINKECRRVAIDERMWAGHFLALRTAFPDCAFFGASVLMGQVRVIKDAAEMALLEQAGARADQVMGEVMKELRPGLAEKEVAFFIESRLRAYGAEDLSFKPIVASGANGASPHHHTGDRKLSAGDLVILDFGGVFQGYCSDITRTFCLGKPSEEIKRVYRAVQEANEAGFAAAREGTACEKVDQAARDVIARAGYGPYFIHRTGHGIGLDCHEDPYLVSGNEEKLARGMTFSIEPGIYLPGQFGVRIEDIAGISPAGPVRFNHFSRELIEV
ncbi:M24 family metallopeptidase [Candidatus Formimonas warabiya]|uniref:Xaa-Pro aminopeptidase n=1 Tax=Formimonas warabiya TaxID=1761012 RepID=A0A3G1KRC3_FORW1|nr:Xaa-Pro peptidase family protein [Candidatus Formimonas warabiya]ATW25014.1 Xaa-Pro aminopeptidase [Candidatus Formimonas warabiya]